MKHKRFWKIALFLAVPLALYAFIAERKSENAQTIETLADDGTRCVRFSPQGRYLVIWTPSSDSRSPCEFYEVNSRRIILTLESVDSPCFLDEQHFAVTNSLTGCTEVYSLPTGKLLASSAKDFCPFVALSDGRTLLGKMTRGTSGQISAWDYRWGRSLFDFPVVPPLPSPDSLRGFDLLADKQTLAITDYSRNAPHRTQFQLWDMSKRKRLPFPAKHYESLSMGTTTAAGLCVTGSNSVNRCEIWNYKTGRRLNSFVVTLPASKNSPSHVPTTCAISPDGTLLAGGSEAGANIGLWDTRTGRLLRLLNSNPSEIYSLDFSPDSHLLAVGGAGTVQLWRIK